MGGTSHQQSQSASQSVSQPWQPAQPVLQGILSGAQSQLPNYGLNPNEQAAISQMTQNAQATPNFAPQATDLTNRYLTGDPTGLLNPALQNYNTALSPIATGELDPTRTPGIQNVLETIRNDVSNSVNGMFAGAGRDLSGLNTQTLARGIAQGEAPVLLDQYNQNVRNRLAAAGGLFGAAGNTANDMTRNQGNAFNLAQAIPQLMNMGPQGVLAAQQLQRQIPLQNLGMLANLSVPIAGLGGQTNNTSNSQGSQTMSGAQQFATIAGGIGGLFGG